MPLLSKLPIAEMSRASDMDFKGVTGKPILDPAEYLFQNTKYHNRHFTVGAPDADEIEEIGVVTINLVSHSTVFRDMLEDSMLADVSGRNTHITDVTPAVFKLVLRHVYGGELPSMSTEIAVELLFCADKYNIQSLVKRTSALLVPTSVNDLFPALKCVTYVSLPDLLPHVTKLLQEQTAQVVENEQFLQLDDNCLVFIVKQETLAVSELQLWRSLVSWASARTEDLREKRDLLTKPLQHVRLLTLNHTQILKGVMNCEVLEPAELVDLLTAVTKNKTLTVPGLCSIKEKRRFSGGGKLPPANRVGVVKKKAVVDPFENTYTLNSEYYLGTVGVKLVKLPYYQTSCNFTVKLKNNESLVESFIIQTRSLSDEKCSSYYFECVIAVYIFDDLGYISKISNIETSGQVVCGEDFAIPLKTRNGEPLILAPNTCCNFILNFTKAHPVFGSEYLNRNKKSVDSTYTKREYGNFGSITFNTPIQVKRIVFKTKSLLDYGF